MSTNITAANNAVEYFGVAHSQIMTQEKSTCDGDISLERAEQVLRTADGKLLPGVVLNPNGRPKSAKIVSDAIKQALADGKAEDVKDKLFGLMDEADRDSVRLAAISEIMDRSEGKAVQNVRHAGVFMVLAPGEDVLAAAFGGSAPDESE